MRPVLYLTIDGVLGHLGFGQVLRVLQGLAGRGVPYVLVSMERASDIEDAVRLSDVRARLAAAGIDWHHATYREGQGARGAAANLARFARLAASTARARGAGLVHARGYHSGLVARALRAALGVPYVFDARGAWIDERIEDNRWFTTVPRVRVARALEHRLYRDARAVVTLTQLHADDVTARHRPASAMPVLVVPTCASYEEFRPMDESSLQLVPEDARRALRGKIVIGVVGALNKSYQGAPTAALVAAAMRRDPDVRLLVLSAQRDAWQRCLDGAGVPSTRVLFARAAHEAMPEWLSLMDWGLLLLTADTAAKRGSVPTKLAEFFASGVRPIIHGCNSEVREWVRRAGSGAVLENLDRRSLDSAAELIASPTDVEMLRTARRVTADHFSLAAGVDRYLRLLHAVDADRSP